MVFLKEKFHKELILSKKSSKKNISLIKNKYKIKKSILSYQISNMVIIFFKIKKILKII